MQLRNLVPLTSIWLQRGKMFKNATNFATIELCYTLFLYSDDFQENVKEKCRDTLDTKKRIAIRNQKATNEIETCDIWKLPNFRI